MTVKRFYSILLTLGLMVLIPRTGFSEGSGFALDQISETFPSTGLEGRIEFWKLIFTKYGEGDIVFHDMDDLRLIYHVEPAPGPAAKTKSERRRQQTILKGKQDEIARLLKELGKPQTELGDRHRSLLNLLKASGYAIGPATLSRLSENIRYQRGIREKFREGLVRSGRYLPHIERIFAEYGLPVELSLMPHVESSFDYGAYSKVGAAGIWQFTKSTGRLYLKIDRYVDERLDPIVASDAAARLLRDNFSVLASWPLAVTSYNHGKYGMLRAKQRHGSDMRTIIENYQSRSFGFASKNFYAEFLAAVEVARNSERYFGPVELDPILEFDSVVVERSQLASQLASAAGLNLEEFRSFNPHIRGLTGTGNRTVPRKTQIRFPAGRRDQVLAILGGGGAPGRAAGPAAEDGQTYTVEAGDSLVLIAARYGTSVAQLQEFNGLSNPHRISVGQTLFVAPPQNEPREAAETPRQKVTGEYRVERGDTLQGIAKRYGTTIGELERLNSIGNVHAIHPGQILRLPSESRTEARRYTVRRGDSLAQIARKFGVSVSEIQKVNGIQDPHRIRNGQELLIP